MLRPVLHQQSERCHFYPLECHNLLCTGCFKVCSGKDVQGTAGLCWSGSERTRMLLQMPSANLSCEQATPHCRSYARSVQMGCVVFAVQQPPEFLSSLSQSHNSHKPRVSCKLWAELFWLSCLSWPCSPACWEQSKSRAAGVVCFSSSVLSPRTDGRLRLKSVLRGGADL